MSLIDNIEPPVRWACVRDGEFVWPAGPMPYFWVDPNTGTRHEMTALTDTEKADLGWQEVTARGWFQHDTEIHSPNTPAMTIEAGKVYEDYTYDFTPDAINAMQRKVDDAAETARGQFITLGAGQALEYEETLREAMEVDAMTPAEQAQIGVGDFPMLDASIAVDYDATLEREVVTVAEVAALVLSNRQEWKLAGGAIKGKRLSTKKQIRDAANTNAAFAIYDNLTY